MMIWLLIGCHTRGLDDNPLLEGIVVPELSYSLSIYTDQIQTVFSHGIPDAEEAKQAYLSWRSNGDAFCPGQGYQLQGIIEPCTSSTGYIFSGMATVMGATNQLSIPDFFEVEADCYIMDPSEKRFVGAGELLYESTGTRTNGSIFSSIVGTWESPLHDGWLGTNNSLWLAQHLAWTNPENWNLELNGAYHLDEIALRFHSLNIGPDCQGGTGGLEIRDPNGYWLHITLPENCSGCGEAMYDGIPQGEICLNLFESATTEYQQQQVH